jgi:cysteine desulfurase
MPAPVYFDYAAATPLDKRVQAAMEPYWQEHFHNPSATYLAAQAMRADVEQARATVAGVLGVRPAEIIFTAGGTEANNLAIKGVGEKFPDAHMVTTALEHDSVRVPMQLLNATEIAPEASGVVDASKVLAAVTDNTVLVSVMYANNEIGTVQPLKEIARGLEQLRKARQTAGNALPLYLHTDACQAANYLDLHVHRLGVDLMTLNGGKIYGPKQSGVLMVASHVQLAPQVLGGGQEFNRRSGTENVPGIIGLAAALERTVAVRTDEVKRLQTLQKQLIDGLEKQFPDCRINGSRKQRLPNNVHVTFPGADNERLLFALDEAGIQAAAGSACSASHEEASHVLHALGLSDDEARASLRLTMGRDTTEAHVRYLVETLAKIVH